MALADDFKAQAIQWKVTNAQAEKTAAEARINVLGTRAQQAIASYGASYIQISNSGEDVPIYQAIINRYGKAYLESLGFRIEALSTHANIWWADPVQLEAEVEAILNPPPAPEPENPVQPLVGGTQEPLKK